MYCIGSKVLLARERMERKVFVISGPSGSGKTSILNKLIKKKTIRAKFVKILTATTRPPRCKEKDGLDYLFLSKERFSKLKERRYFLETKKFLDDFYGTPNHLLCAAFRKNKFPLLCIDVEGALKVKKKFGSKAVLIFIYPPSQSALISRLKKRDTESKQILKKRLRIAKKEVKYAQKYDYRVTNIQLDKTVEELENILLGEISTTQRASKAKRK